MKRVLLVVLIGVFVATTAFASGEQEAAGMDDEQNYTFGTSGIGGVFFIVGAALTNLWNVEMGPDVVWSTETSGGSTSNIIWLSEGEIDLGLVSAGRIDAARNGTGFFEDEGALDLSGVRAFALGHGNYSQPVTLVDNSASVARDLRGQRVSVGEPGHSAQAYLEKYADAWGWVPEDEMTYEYLDGNAQLDALLQGRIDAMWFAAGIGDPVITEAFLTLDVKMLPFEEATRETVTGQYPFHSRGTIPAGTYEGQTEDIPILGETATILIHESVPDDVAYDLVRILWENKENGNLGTVHRAFNEFSLNPEIQNITGLELHPGAKRYYEEIGIDVR